ncbi:MAG: S41 family peptidase [bacterium]
MKNIKNSIFIAILALFLCLNLQGCVLNNQKILSSFDNLGKSPQDVFLNAWGSIKNQYFDKNYNHQNWSKWKSRYIKQIKTKDDAYLAIETMIESLNDPYTRFLPPSDFEEQDRTIDSKLDGIGVHITNIKGFIEIFDIIDGTPAKKSGLKEGDIILKINQTSTKSLNLKEVADMIRGEAGTSITLTLLRNKKEIIKDVFREKIIIKTVEYKILDKNYAYIKILSFMSNDTAGEMVEILNKIKNIQNIKGIILDLRGNHGGLLPNAIFISNMFINKGIIVSIVDKNGFKKNIKAEGIGLLTNKPLVILINQGSASASEILSGALKEHERAILVGETTFGKGLVQKIQRLPDNSGINITVAKYLTPDGHDIDKKGIKPDYTVKFTREDFLNNRDPQLDKAKQILTGKV